MIRKHRVLVSLAALGLAAVVMFLLADREATDATSDEGEVHGEEFERGRHGGRLLRDGNFALEVTIFEEGVDPQFRVYAYLKDRPLKPEKIQLSIAVTRLGGRLDQFAFRPEGEFLSGDGVVREPHSFDVAVRAVHNGDELKWSYPSYEGRTTIAAAQADAAGVKVEPSGPATLRETVALSGRVELQPEGRAEIVALYPGRIVDMTKSIGAAVQQGETLARVTSSESLQTYAMSSPISGVVMARNANVGDVAGATPIYVIADARQVHAEFYAYPRDAEKLRAGQEISVRNLGGNRSVRAKIETILPTTDMLSQTVVAHVHLPNEEGTWRPGQAVEGEVVIASHDVPLAVRTPALQRFREFNVVYARVGETYEVRMLDLGQRTPEWTEVLGGLEPGEMYVSENAFLIRADVEKSGASHDH